MRVHCLRQMGYEGTQIYIMHFDNIFQYLFSWRNEIFQQHVVIKPLAHKKIANALFGLPLYTLADLEGAEHSMLSGAMDSIDILKKMKTKRDLARKSDSKCMWRVRVAENNDPLYECLYHNVEVPFEEGKIPIHTVTVDYPNVAQ